MGFCVQVSCGLRVEGAAPYAMMWCDESCSYHQGYVGDEIVFATMGVKFVERERRGLEIAPDRAWEQRWRCHSTVVQRSGQWCVRYGLGSSLPCSFLTHLEGDQ